MPNTSPTPDKAIASARPPIALHYVRKRAIGTGKVSVALCGEQGAYGTKSTIADPGNTTSYTCPDCLIRYMLLTGGASNA